MTPTTKRTVRVSTDTASHRPIVVAVGPGPLLAFRLKGTRTEFTTTAGACYALAVRQHVQAERGRKAQARRAKA